MRLHRVAVVLITSLLLVAACSGDDGVSLTAAEQKYADSMAKDLSSKDTGFGVTSDEADCMAGAVMDTLGVAPFEKAGVSAKEVAGDKSPGELLGAGVVSNADATTIASAWRDCADLPAAFASSAKSQFSLDTKGVSCLEKGLRKSKVLDDYIKASFTSTGAGDSSTVLQGLVGLVDDCSGGASGDGGVIVDSIAKSLASTGALTDAQSKCVAQKVVDTIGQERLISLTANGDISKAPVEVQQELAAAVTGAAKSCGVSTDKLGG